MTNDGVKHMWVKSFCTSAVWSPGGPMTFTCSASHCQHLAHSLLPILNMSGSPSGCGEEERAAEEAEVRALGVRTHLMSRLEAARRARRQMDFL